MASNQGYETGDSEEFVRSLGKRGGLRLRATAPVKNAGKPGFIQHLARLFWQLTATIRIEAE